MAVLLALVVMLVEHKVGQTKCYDGNGNGDSGLEDLVTTSLSQQDRDMGVPRHRSGVIEGCSVVISISPLHAC